MVRGGNFDFHRIGIKLRPIDEFGVRGIEISRRKTSSKGIDQITVCGRLSPLEFFALTDSWESFIVISDQREA